MTHMAYLIGASEGRVTCLFSQAQLCNCSASRFKVDSHCLLVRGGVCLTCALGIGHWPLLNSANNRLTFAITTRQLLGLQAHKLFYNMNRLFFCQPCGPHREQLACCAHQVFHLFGHNLAYFTLF